MMYNSKMVACVKANGQILREFGETVYVPFGAEYSILLKNLNARRAIVHIFIDGEDITASGLVLNANSSLDLERSLSNGSLTQGNKFKFIERTSAVENHRGVQAEDGIIRIEFQYERPPVVSAHDFYTKGMIGQSFSAHSLASRQATRQVTACATPQNEAGITVAGSKSEQSFSTVAAFPLESTKEVIVLRLLGETQDNQPVVAPVTVQTKVTCSTCGTTNTPGAKFCSECGTSLVIY